MGRLFPFLILGLLALYTLIEVVQADPRAVRALPRLAWGFLVLLIPGIGPIGWLLLGRPTRRTRAEGSRRVVAPDDDPDFLRRLKP